MNMKEQNEEQLVEAHIETFKEQQEGGAYYWKVTAQIPGSGKVNFAHSMRQFTTAEQCAENVEMFMDLMKGIVKVHRPDDQKV